MYNIEHRVFQTYQSEKNWSWYLESSKRSKKDTTCDVHPRAAPGWRSTGDEPGNTMYILEQVFKNVYNKSVWPLLHFLLYNTKRENYSEAKRDFFLSFKNECLSSYILHCFKCNKGNTHFFMNNIFQNFNTAESAWKLSKALSSAALYKIFKNPKCCMV